MKGSPLFLCIFVSPSILVAFASHFNSWFFATLFCLFCTSLIFHLSSLMWLPVWNLRILSGLVLLVKEMLVICICEFEIDCADAVFRLRSYIFHPFFIGLDCLLPSFFIFFMATDLSYKSMKHWGIYLSGFLVLS